MGNIRTTYNHNFKLHHLNSIGLAVVTFKLTLFRVLFWGYQIKLWSLYHFMCNLIDKKIKYINDK